MTRPVSLLSLTLAKAGPGWFTSVMGTGILAIGIAASPLALPGGRHAALGLWLAATALFAALCLLLAARVVLRPAGAVDVSGPATVHAWGAPPMAFFTIAVGALVIGVPAFGPAVCIPAAQALFLAGVAGSIASAFIVPLRLFTNHDLTLEHVGGSWLLPVVPPIVASVPAALLSATWPEALRGSMLGLAYALLGSGVLLAGLVISVVFMRLLLHKVPRGPMVPTMWILVGPLGQSIAGFIALGRTARVVWPAYGDGLAFAGVAYGVVVWGFAMYWLAMAIVTTLRARRDGIPFTLGWWAFTFPVGVLTAGTVALFHETQAAIYGIASTALLALLAAMWILVSAHTVRGIVLAARGARGDRERGSGAEHPITRIA